MDFVLKGTPVFALLWEFFIFLLMSLSNWRLQRSKKKKKKKSIYFLVGCFLKFVIKPICSVSVQFCELVLVLI